MKQCWPEGDLRAFVDGELPVETQQQIAAHLTTCQECESRHRQLADRAARVSSLMAALPVAPAPALPLHLVARGKSRPTRWVAAAAALAAGVAIGFIAIPRGARSTASIPEPVAVEKPAVGTSPQPLAKADDLPPAVSRPVVRHRTVRQSVVRPAIAHADFLRLDDEPLETGTVVRVSVQDGDVQADLIVGPDGRAHAIRLVSGR